MNIITGDPYFSSRNYCKGPWYDSFARKGEIAWLVFWGDKLLARVENQQQAKNLLQYLEKSKC